MFIRKSVYLTKILYVLVSTCPSNYRWDSTVHLCYLVEESPRIWQDAKAYCESIGARLAILDTPSKLDLILSGNILLRRFEGQQFNL